MKPIEKNWGDLKPPLAVLSDFDDTAAIENVAELLMERFGGSEWRGLREQFHSGRFTLREYQEAAFSIAQASRDKMTALVQEKATLRPHFKELHAYCRQHDIPLAIVSNGLDFYVDALLQREGLGDVPYYTVCTRFSSNGIEFSYPYAVEGCGDFGNCKCKVLERYRSEGRKVLYVGDGRSDFCASTAADLVFARSDLLVCCRKYGIAHVPFQDFSDVLTILKELVEESCDD